MIIDNCVYLLGTLGYDLLIETQLKVKGVFSDFRATESELDPNRDRIKVRKSQIVDRTLLSSTTPILRVLVDPKMDKALL